jgi:hypothetical protein
MPVQWSVSHPNRLVIAIATGNVDLADIEAYLDCLLRENLQAYRKLFDVSRGTLRLSDDHHMALGARIRAYVPFGPLGPVAIVVRKDESYEDAMMFATLATADRPLQIFHEASLARHWLELQPAP